MYFHGGSCYEIGRNFVNFAEYSNFIVVLFISVVAVTGKTF